MVATTELLDAAANGRRLSADELGRLFEQAPLLDLGQAAQAVRRRLTDPGVVTYIIDRNINYTNVCGYRCRFCAFYRDAQDSDAYLLTADEVILKIAETVASGGTGVLLQGGVHPGLRLGDYVALVRRLKETFPHVHLHAFSAPEIFFIAEQEERSLAEVIAALREAGLDSIPGGGAEVLEDETRRRISSARRVSSSQWLEVHAEAHRQGLRTTATMMLGVGEPVMARVHHLVSLRRLQDRTGGFTAFIPWTFQDCNTDLAGIGGAGGHDYLRTLAISRLALDNFAHVQGSWVTQGAKVAQLSLFFGADDLGSLMLEENVVAAAGVRFRMSQQDMERTITGAGFVPRQRRTLYEPL